MIDPIYLHLRKLKKTIYLQISLILFLVSIILIILGATLKGDFQEFTPIFLGLGFSLFFVEFGFLIAFAISTSKNETKIKELIINDFWIKHIENWTYELSDHFDMSTSKDDDQRLLNHPMIPRQATEKFYFRLMNLSADLTLFALRYMHITSTGKGTTQVVDFSGYVIPTPMKVSSNLYIRKWDFNEKMKGIFMVPKPEIIDMDTAINGDYQEDLKAMRHDLLSIGFKDVIFIEVSGNLVVLCEELSLIPKISKQKEENENRHKTHVLKLIQVLINIDKYLN